MPTSQVVICRKLRWAPVRSRDLISSFRLDPPLDHLGDNEREMIGLLIDAAAIMDELFWHQAYGDRGHIC